MIDFADDFHEIVGSHESVVSGSLAQPVEHLPFKERVLGSSPRRATIFQGSLRLEAQDIALSRRRHGFDSRRERQLRLFLVHSGNYGTTELLDLRGSAPNS